MDWMSAKITFDFACRDDCLDQMIPSDLRQLVAERDKLKALLNEAHDHLEYCGYGDSWEREVAREAKLPERLDAALCEEGGEEDGSIHETSWGI